MGRGRPQKKQAPEIIDTKEQDVNEETNNEAQKAEEIGQKKAVYNLFKKKENTGTFTLQLLDNSVNVDNYDVLILNKDRNKELFYQKILAYFEFIGTSKDFNIEGIEDKDAVLVRLKNNVGTFSFKKNSIAVNSDNYNLGFVVSRDEYIKNLVLKDRTTVLAKKDRILFVK